MAAIEQEGAARAPEGREATSPASSRKMPVKGRRRKGNGMAPTIAGGADLCAAACASLADMAGACDCPRPDHRIG